MSETQRQMPRYKSHKEVWALRIARIEPELASQGAIITPVEDGYTFFKVSRDYLERHKPQIGGYYVRYADGYESFSPAQAFEEGYKALDGAPQHDPLPVAGYKAQSSDTVDDVNHNKAIEERLLRQLDRYADDPAIDKRWLAIGRTHIEQGFMAVNRAIFQPARIDLPEDGPPINEEAR